MDTSFVGVERFYAGQELYQLAELWGKKYAKVCQVLFTDDHPDVATLNNLALLYKIKE